MRIHGFMNKYHVKITSCLHCFQAYNCVKTPHKLFTAASLILQSYSCCLIVHAIHSSWYVLATFVTHQKILQLYVVHILMITHYVLYKVSKDGTFTKVETCCSYVMLMKWCINNTWVHLSVFISYRGIGARILKR